MPRKRETIKGTKQADDDGYSSDHSAKGKETATKLSSSSKPIAKTAPSKPQRTSTKKGSPKTSQNRIVTQLPIFEYIKTTMALEVEVFLSRDKVPFVGFTEEVDGHQGSPIKELIKSFNIITLEKVLDNLQRKRKDPKLNIILCEDNPELVDRVADVLSDLDAFQHIQLCSRFPQLREVFTKNMNQNKRRNRVSFTFMFFDNSPKSEITLAFQVAKKYDAFVLTASLVDRYPDLIQEMDQKGLELGFYEEEEKSGKLKRFIERGIESDFNLEARGFPCDGTLTKPSPATQSAIKTKKGRKSSSEKKSDSKDSDDDSYEVEAIVGKRIDQDNKVFYWVKWKNFSDAERTWEPLEHMTNCQQSIDIYEKQGVEPDQSKGKQHAEKTRTSTKKPSGRKGKQAKTAATDNKPEEPLKPNESSAMEIESTQVTEAISRALTFLKTPEKSPPSPIQTRMNDTENKMISTSSQKIGVILSPIQKEDVQEPEGKMLAESVPLQKESQDLPDKKDRVWMSSPFPDSSVGKITPLTPLQSNFKKGESSILKSAKYPDAQNEIVEERHIEHIIDIEIQNVESKPLEEQEDDNHVLNLAAKMIDEGKPENSGKRENLTKSNEGSHPESKKTPPLIQWEYKDKPWESEQKEQVFYSQEKPANSLAFVPPSTGGFDRDSSIYNPMTEDSSQRGFAHDSSIRSTRRHKPTPHEISNHFLTRTLPLTATAIVILLISLYLAYTYWSMV